MNKRRRAQGINSGSSQFRVTPQLIVQVRWSQVSPSNRRPLGINAVTEELRPPSLSSVFQQSGSALSKQSEASFSHSSLKNSLRLNVTLLIQWLCLKRFTLEMLFLALSSKIIPLQFKLLGCVCVHVCERVLCVNLLSGCRSGVGVLLSVSPTM